MALPHIEYFFYIKSVYHCVRKITIILNLFIFWLKRTLTETRIEIIESKPFHLYRKKLRNFNVEIAKYLHTIKPDAFSEIENLQSVSIKEAPLLKTVDPLVLSSCPSQFSLEIIKSGLEKTITIKHRKDKVVHHLQFDNDKLRVIEPFTFRVYVEMMSINDNLIESIEDNAFNDSHIGHLSLRGNRVLSRLSDKAFKNINALNKLDLSDTSIIKLPTIGLKDLEVIRIMNTYSLKVLPSFITELTEVKEAHLTYPYHCCAFQFPRKEPEFAAYKTFYKSYCLDKVSTTTLSPSEGYSDREAEWLAPFDIPNTTIPITNHSAELLGENIDQSSNGSNSLQKFFTKHCGRVAQLESNPVICTPKPDAFNPCEDIMGNNWLRITVWFVLVAALFGNFSVFVILFSGKLPMSVSKFLMCNLAAADFLMGVYLFIIAAFDLRTMGNYFNFAIDWQHGLGCKVAGFITVFSSELSIYTLTVITMERYFPIAYPLQIDKRLKLSLAIKVMLGGWIYSIAMAALPLPIIGISSYSKTSICLPMETRNKYDIAYLIFILCFSAVDFILISACYAKMYLSIVSQKTRATNNDMKVAKGMALLVFTDFACFMPITFFGLTAIAGYPLIDVTRSKILLVFFFPLNSMANPFLYTITKQFRRDFHSLASRFSLCTGKALRFRSVPCTHQAYYKHKHHRHRHGKCLATIGSAPAANSDNGSSNSQSIIPVGYSNYNTNSYSASISQLSNSMYNDSYLNSRCSKEFPDDKGRHGRIHRYYYRNPYPHHHFSVSKQYRYSEPPFEACCTKYNRNDHKNHVHCYHHHKKHPHSAPVSQVNESISIGQESNSENLAPTDSRKTNNNQTNKNLNLNKYLNTALSTSILYNQNNSNLSSGSSSTDYCGMAVSGNQIKCVDSTKAYCSRCTNKKSMIKCLTLFKHNYLFHNRDQEHHGDLHNRQDSDRINEIGDSLTTGTTFDSNFTTTNNPPTALTQLSLESNVPMLNGTNIVEHRKPDQNETNKGCINRNKLLNYSKTTAAHNMTATQIIKCEMDKNAFQAVDSYQSINFLPNDPAIDVRSVSEENLKKDSKQKNGPIEGSTIITKRKLMDSECNRKQANSRKKNIKFKLSARKQQSGKTNDFELQKIKNTKSHKLINNDQKNGESNNLLKPSVCLDLNQSNHPNLGSRNVTTSDDNLSKEHLHPTEIYNNQQNNNRTAYKHDQTTKSNILEDLMENQITDKPMILKKWINSGRRKCYNTNCHTNFKMIKIDSQNCETNLKNEPIIDVNQQEICGSKLFANNLNKSIGVLMKETGGEEQTPVSSETKKKHSLLSSKLTISNKADTLFSRIFRSLTSSSSNSNNASNPSGNTSDNMSIQQNSNSNGCVTVDGLNERSSVEKIMVKTSLKPDDSTANEQRSKSNESLELKGIKNSQSFNLELVDKNKNSIENNSFRKLNLSLGDLQTPSSNRSSVVEKNSGNSLKV